MARPSKYDNLDKGQAEKLAKSGWTDEQMADFFGVTEQTWNNWKKKDPEFFESLKDWKAEADHKVERSLYERATGYSHPDTHISNYQGVVTETLITKHYPPDTTAAIFWLKNRQPEQWRDAHEYRGEIAHKHEHTVVSESTQRILDELAGQGEDAGDKVSRTH